MLYRVINTVITIFDCLFTTSPASAAGESAVLLKSKKVSTAGIIIDMLHFVLALPSISLNLISDTTSVELVIKTLQLTVHQRNVDSFISFNIGALSIRDKSGKMIMWTHFKTAGQDGGTGTPEEMLLASFTTHLLSTSKLLYPEPVIKAADRARVLYSRPAEREDELTITLDQVVPFHDP